jgi:dihydroxyacid dehydratase/phosphogluconate dehydratase
MDGVLVIGGCDKNMPGGMIGMLEPTCRPSSVYGGTIKPGNWKGKDLTIVSAFEAVGEFTAPAMSQEDFDGIEQNASRASAPAAACTPPTRCLRVRGHGHEPARTPPPWPTRIRRKG